jgi:hypothetical protein
MDPEDRKIYRGVRNTIFKWVVGFVMFGLAIWGIVYAITYFTAEGRGRVALHNEARSAEELRESYEYFHDTCRSVIAQTQQIATVQEDLDARIAARPVDDPFGQYEQQIGQVQTQLTGLKNVRASTAQEYNAKSHEFTHNFMKSHDLPDEIGPPNGVEFESLSCEGA